MIARMSQKQSWRVRRSFSAVSMAFFFFFKQFILISSFLSSSGIWTSQILVAARLPQAEGALKFSSSHIFFQIDEIILAAKGETKWKGPLGRLISSVVMQ